MSKFLKQTALIAAFASFVFPAFAETFGLGREALPEEIEAWDIDIRPDGQGLPVGSGSVETGEELFLAQCASCHGDFAEGLDRWPVLAGGLDTLASEDPVKTVGSYWPYLSTAYDYIFRAMPFGNAQSLSPDEVYGSIAYILYMNDLVEDDFVLSNENFASVRLPNEGNFDEDIRPDTSTLSQAEPCMRDCKEAVEITKRARIIDVTPDDETVENSEEQLATVAVELTLDQPLVESGARLFKKRCQSCHRVEAGSHRSGPSLHEIFNRKAATIEGFKRYSKALREADLAWDEATLHAFLTKPSRLVKGTRMSFAGLKKYDDRAAVIEYLKSISSPVQ